MPAIPLVPRQPPVAPLNADAQQALADLKRQQRISKQLTHHLTQAAEQLTAVAEQLNDRSTIYSIEHRKKRRRAEANGEEEDEQEKADYDEFQTKAQELTRKLDNGVRSVVDHQTWLQGLPEAVKEIARKADALAETAQRQTHQADRETADETEDEPVTAYPAPPAPEEAPSALMKAAREALTADWASRSLTERYSQHNTYIGFYRMVHDAKHPGEDGPPIPHHSLWFAHEEDVNPSYVPPGTQTQRAHRSNPRDTSNEEGTNNQDSSDIEVARERISIKCPITYLPFTDPLTSTKCPHSFDRPGIMAMLHRSETSIPLTDAQTAELAQIPDSRARGRKAAEMRRPAIQCPVCSILLAESDFRPDPVLLRKVQRIQAAQAREQERNAASSDADSDESDSDPSDGNEEDGIVVARERGTQRKPVGVGSSPLPASGRKRRSAMEVKREREKSKSRAVSVVPATQLETNEEEH